jgi:hypothetical protein
MDRAIKTAVSKESGKNGNPIVDTSTINYLYNAERTASVYSGQINATFLDDYITNKTTSVRVGNEIVNVGQRLDFKMDYSPFSQVINQNGKTGQFVNVLKAGEETQSVKLGLDTASIKVNIGQIDLTNAELTSQNKNFTDILVANGATLKDRYNNTDITPSISLTVPKANNMLSDKVFDNSNISSIGSLVFTTSSDGANGNLTNANTDIKPSIYTTISCGNFTNTKQVTTTATKNKFNVSLNTSADNTVATAYKSKIPTSANQNYYYGQTYSYNTSMYGHSAYENASKYDSNTFAGTVGADNISKSLVYKPNEYKVTIDYSTKYDIDKPSIFGSTENAVLVVSIFSPNERNSSKLNTS